MSMAVYRPDQLGPGVAVELPDPLALDPEELAFLESMNDQARAEFIATATYRARVNAPHPMDAYDSPSRWAKECIRWPRPDQGLTSYQAETMDRVLENGRVAMRGPHTAGKTTTSALTVLYFALKWEADAQRGRIKDWLIVTTASYWLQVEKFLWRYIRMWARYIRWDKVGFAPLREGREIFTTKLVLNFGMAFGVAPENLEGAHADRILWLFDEMKDIPDLTFEKAEGAMAGAGEDTDQEAYALGTSTPGLKIGKLWRIHNREPGNEDWYPLVVTAEMCIAAKRMSAIWKEQRKREWGEDSQVYQNRVLGNFSAQDTDGVVPLSWIELANQRWEEINRTGDVGDFAQIGVDLANQGKDRTVFAPRYRNGFVDFIDTLRYYSKETPLRTGDRLAAILDRLGGEALIDVLPDGTAVAEYIVRMGNEARTFNGGEAARDVQGQYYTDRSGSFRFRNRRSHMIWRIRELLDPSLDPAPVLALPKDDNLIGDLTIPHFNRNGNVITVESKDDFRKRLKLGPGEDRESTDAGDAVGLALYELEDYSPQEIGSFDILGAARLDARDLLGGII